MVDETRKLKAKYIDQNYERNNIHMNLFDEGEKNSKNSLITWNNNKGIVIFAKDKKKSQSKRYRRIGYHMIISNEEEDDSPYLVIVKENEESRIVKKRNEERGINPYESMRNIKMKNEILKKYVIEDERDQNYNKRIEMINEMIKADQGFIDILKNSIIETDAKNKRRKSVYLIIECLKKKIKISEKGIKFIEYLVIWVLRDRDFNETNEIRFSAKFVTTKEDEFKVLIRSLIIGMILIVKGSNILLGIDEKVRRCLENFKCKNLLNYEMH
ncbi:unnamed protein product [Rhizophagus irregularis]|nr:unnamed protein product [Rhizophagus irregularis]